MATRDSVPRPTETALVWLGPFQWQGARLLGLRNGLTTLESHLHWRHFVVPPRADSPVVVLARRLRDAGVRTFGDMASLQYLWRILAGTGDAQECEQTLKSPRSGSPRRWQSPSSTPLAAFSWGGRDLSTRGLGQTTLVPRETITVATDGTPGRELPATILFRDAESIRPAAPFFALHVRGVSDAGQPFEGPLTPELLGACGAAPQDVVFELSLANLTAYHHTYEPGDRIEARARVSADEHAPVPLDATSPGTAPAPLVPAGARLFLRQVQMLRPTDELPDLRCRFAPPAGLIYGPNDLMARSSRERF